MSEQEVVRQGQKREASSSFHSLFISFFHNQYQVSSALPPEHRERSFIFGEDGLYLYTHTCRKRKQRGAVVKKEKERKQGE